MVQSWVTLMFNKFATNERRTKKKITLNNRNPYPSHLVPILPIL